MKKIIKTLIVVALILTASYGGLVLYNRLQVDGGQQVNDMVAFLSKKTGIIADDEHFSDDVSAGNLLRRKMINRTHHIDITYFSRQKIDAQEIAKNIYQEAIKHTGVPNEGDYLHYSLSRVTISSKRTRIINGYHYDLAYDINYRTTLSKEQLIDKKVKAIVASVKGANYQKIKQLNDYLVHHMYYSDRGRGDQYTAYGALVNGHGVCQAYTLAYYRLLLEAKIDNRMITGLSVQPTGRENHTWNIVKLGNRYYEVDVTWNDAEGRKNMYFLKGDLQFKKSHHADDIYKTTAFQSKYPLSLYDHQ